MPLIDHLLFELAVQAVFIPARAGLAVAVALARAARSLSDDDA